MIVFYGTAPFFLTLALSYLLASRSRLLSVEFAFCLITYQFIFIGALGIGLIQSHIGCPMPLGDCYVEGYPSELYVITSAFNLATMAWILGAIVMSSVNVFSRFRNDASRT